MLRATREFEVGNGWHLEEKIATRYVCWGTSLDMVFMEKIRYMSFGCHHFSGVPVLKCKVVLVASQRPELSTRN